MSTVGEATCVRISTCHKVHMYVGMYVLTCYNLEDGDNLISEH